MSLDIGEPPVAVAADRVQTERPDRREVARRILAPLASLKPTVVLFALGIVLVFCGTLAQVDAGIWTAVNTYFRSLMVWIPLQIFFPRTMNVPGAFPFPGGWLIGSLLLVNLLAAHLTRFRLIWKRAGVMLLHAGVVVLMLSEFVTGMFAVEGNMSIDEGQASDFVESTQATELAVIDSSNPKLDDVAVVPGRMLERGGLIRHDLLPFDVEVVGYMVNSSDLLGPNQAPAGTQNPATAGIGRQVVAVERPEVTGTEPEQKVDVASAYVTFKKKGTGESLGTYLVSAWLSMRDHLQQVTVDGKTYYVDLRFKRMYKPYAIHLIDFRHDTYLGTDKPRNFSSLVRVVDPARDVDREALIYMNTPLRYAGETFYQSSFKPGDRGTVLQVVRNPGWLMPYVACAMVSGGMAAHFLTVLYGFLRRRTSR